MIFFTKKAGHRRRGRVISVGRVVVVLSILVLPVAAFWMAFHYGQESQRPYSEEWRQELAHYRGLLDQSRDHARMEVNALAMRLGQLQAQVIRLNALGERLVDQAGFDQGEFDFSRLPGQGGPETQALVLAGLSENDFVAQMDRLSVDLRDRERQLSVLESLYQNRALDKASLPSGRPVRKGWISSYFGMRVDPFNGRRVFHKGLDLAGKAGTDVIAIADGVVTWSGRRYGYGNMVEVNHGNGYVTRYAHNEKNRVRAGDVVQRGQVLAYMGSSGRSTGPHVHLEILKNDRQIDPLGFVSSAQSKK